MPRLAKVPTPPPPGYLWTPEAARRIGLSVKTLWNYRHLGKGPKAERIGRKLAYSIPVLDAWFQAEMETESEVDAARAEESRPPEPRTTRRPASAVA